MVRKDFLKSASLLVGGTVISPLLSASDSLLFQTSVNSLKLKKGIGYGMIQEELSLFDKFKLVKDLGFDWYRIQ